MAGVEPGAEGGRRNSRGNSFVNVAKDSLGDRMARLEKLNERSAKGDPEAQYQLGRIHMEGKEGMVPDPEKVAISFAIIATEPSRSTLNASLSQP